MKEEKTTLKGRILSVIGGFYYVEVDSCGGASPAVLECRARGLFRRKHIVPLVGDLVSVAPSEEGEGLVTEVLPRKNGLTRPPIANLDQLVIVASAAEPNPSPLSIDRLVAAAEKRRIEPMVVVNKTDLASADALQSAYGLARIPFFSLSAFDGKRTEILRKALVGKTSAFAGNSGVGKSTLLNALCPRLSLATGEISRKLRRGRHTTRAVTLYPLPEGGYVADTPGFSSLDAQEGDPVLKEELAACFREFAPYTGRCRFTSCAHIKEKGCAVRRAVESGEIAPSRYASYVAMYRQVKDVKAWTVR